MNQIYNNANYDDFCRAKNLTDYEKQPSSKEKISDSGS